MQQKLFGVCGKTSPASSPPVTTHSAVSWRALSERTPPSSVHLNADGGRVRVWLADPGREQLGGFSTLNISVWPNDASVCSLSSVLDPTPIPQRYFLSPKACAGILRRAEKRGRELPPSLRVALEHVAQTTTRPKAAT